MKRLGLVIFFTWIASFSAADEGMWLYNRPPLEILKTKYQFEPNQQWLDHLQKSSVRFNSGGSGSFVSADGLVITNHHVALDCLQKLGTAEKDYVKSGFYAANRSAEIMCPDLELNVLMSIEDVTDKVKSTVDASMNSSESEKARRATMNAIEQDSFKKTGFRSDVVTLFQGAEYHLYQYKKYTDVRLVFAPEVSIAFFGGDPDNFEYPRYDLDISFFRVYENKQPAHTEHFLKWSASGAAENELVFVSGHPGRTDRLNTLNHIYFLRDTVLPFALNVSRRREVLLQTYSSRSFENERRAHDLLFGYQNGRKLRVGYLAGLQDPALIDRKKAEEESLKQKVFSDARWKHSYGDAWQQVDASLDLWKENYDHWYLYEKGQGFDSELFHIARTLVRLSDETLKSNQERLREYRESNLDSLKFELFSDAPIYKDLEIIRLADSLSMLQELQGAGNSDVLRVLDGKSPRGRAVELVNRTQLEKVAVRKNLLESGKKGIDASDDPMIQLALLVDPIARKCRTLYDQKIDEMFKQSYGKIANAKFVLQGTDSYPDATFTLRLSFGEVKGYRENEKDIPAVTTMTGLYERALEHENKPPFDLPALWLDKKGQLDLKTPMNFVSTADIIGGNSGSPVVNRAGEFVGIVFDSNIEGLIGGAVYTQEQARAVSVHSQGILEALVKLYEAGPLVQELRGATNH